MARTKDQEARENAMHFAISAAGMTIEAKSKTPEALVKSAEVFYEFLTGQKKV